MVSAFCRTSRCVLLVVLVVLVLLLLVLRLLVPLPLLPLTFGMLSDFKIEFNVKSSSSSSPTQKVAISFQKQVQNT